MSRNRVQWRDSRVKCPHQVRARRTVGVSLSLRAEGSQITPPSLVPERPNALFRAISSVPGARVPETSRNWQIYQFSSPGTTRGTAVAQLGYRRQVPTRRAPSLLDTLSVAPNISGFIRDRLHTRMIRATRRRGIPPGRGHISGFTWGTRDLGVCQASANHP